MSASETPSSQLCATCNEINFVEYFEDEGSESSDPMVAHLGKRLQIKKKEECAFCYLVEAALRKASATLGLDDNADVSIMKHCISENDSSDPKKPAKVYCISVQARRTGSNKLFPGGNIQIIADDPFFIALKTSTNLCARVLQGDKFDMELARRWLDICQKEHGPLCTAPGDDSDEQMLSPQPIDLLAIDLDLMCICKMPFGSRFIALSYCWPVKRYLVHLKSNSQELFETGSMLKKMHHLPRTIQDAINCGKQLGFRHLWVDALNIIQDSDEHKTVQLGQMDRVYNAAELTIVSAYPVPPGAEEPCAGLPGYGQYAVSRQRAVRKVKDLRMMVTSRCVDKILQETRWDTRCWTYQERHLSRRLLYFTHEQVYFSCSCNTYCEDMHGVDTNATAYIKPGTTLWSEKSRYLQNDSNNYRYGQWGLSRTLIKGMAPKIQTFERALEEYSYRAVSLPTDILNAFEGIRTVLSEAIGTRFWQGLPELFFDLALCWVLNGPYRKRRIQSEPFVPTNPLFPSWSWAGWESKVNLNCYMPIYEYRSEVDWYIVNQNGAAMRIQTSPEVHFPLTYAEGGNKDVSLAGVHIEDYLSDIIPSDEIDATSNEWRSAKVLASWTAKTTFLLDGSAHSLNGHETVWEQSTNASIKNLNGRVAGCIVIPEDLAEDCAAEPIRWEFILVSRSSQSRYGPLENARQYFDTDVYQDRDWCTLNVMMISRIAEGKALRVGVGIIHEDAWVESRPECAFVQLV